MKRAPVLRYVIISLIGLLIIFIGIKFSKFLSNQNQEQESMNRPRPPKIVSSEKVKYKAVQSLIKGSGRVVAANSVELMSEVQGIIQQSAIPLKAGSNFTKGQLLFSIDDDPYRLTLNAQKSQYLTTIANLLPDLKFDYPASYDKWNTYFSKLDPEKPLPDLPEITDNNEKTFIATKGVINQYYTIKSGEEQLEKYKVYAPFSGTYMGVYLENGTSVNPGSRVATITSSGQLELELPVTVQNRKWVGTGMDVSITHPQSGEQLQGTVARVSESIDPTTQTFNVYVSLSGAGSIFEGMYLEAEIKGMVIEHGMTVPRKAVFDKNLIYEVRADSTLAVTMVNVEQVQTDQIVISGVDTTSWVVAEPLINVYEGMKVIPIQSKMK